MASFTNQITYYTGDASSYSSEITQLLTDAQKSVIARLESMNPDILHLFSGEVTVENDSGVTLDHTKVLNVRRGSYRAVPVNVQHKDLIVDSDSIYYALPQSPAYYIDKSKLYIKPAPEEGDGGTVDKVVYGAIDDANGTIASFPAEFYQAIVLYSAQGVLHMMMVALRDALPDDFDDESSAFDVVSDFELSETGYFSTAPAAPAVPDFGGAGDITDLGDIANLPSAPAYTKPTIGIVDEDIIIPTYPITHGTHDIDLSDSNALIELSVSQSLSLSSVNTLDMTGVTYPAYTAPTIGLAASNPDVTIPVLELGQLSLDLTDDNALIDIDLDTELEAPALTAAVTIGSFGSAPGYTAPEFDTPGYPTITDIDLTKAGNDLISLDAGDIEMLQDNGAIIGASTIDLTGIADHPEYTVPEFDTPGYPTLTDLDLTKDNELISFDAGDIEMLQDNGAIIGASTIDLTGIADVPEYTAPEFDTPGYPTLTDVKLTKDDNDLISIDAGDIAAPTTGQASLSYTETVPGYTAPTAPVVTSDESNPTLVTIASSLGEINDDQDEMDYAQWWNVLSELIEEEEDTELGQLQISKISAYVQAYGTMLQQYQAEAQNALNVFNKENVAYQAGLQVAVQNAQLLDSQYARDLQEYGTLIQQHQQEVTQAVQEWQLNNQRLIDKWTTEYSSRLQQYGVDVQNNLNLFNSLDTAYQKDLQVRIQDATFHDSRSQRAVQEYSSQIQQYSAQINNAVQEWQLNNQRLMDKWTTEYSSRLQEYSVNVQNNLNLFNALDTAYQKDLQRRIQEATFHDSRSQRAVQEYSTQIQQYSAQINNAIQQWTLNNQRQIEKWTTEYGSRLQEYSASIQNNLNTFNEENVVYQGAIQKAIQNAQHADQHSAQLLQKWQGLVAQHQQQINQAVLDYKTQYDVLFQQWQFEYTQKMQEYSLAVQNALNVFNKTNALYQGRIQTATQDAQLAESLEGRKLQKHSALMQEYQAQVNNAVQEWTLDNQKKIDEWQVKYGHKLQEFNTELQNELNVYNGLAAGYQQEVQKLVTEYQLQSQRLMAEGQNDLSRVTQEYSNSLGRYQNELSHYQADLAKEVQVYSTNLSKNIQAFQTQIGKDTLVYQWLQGQLQFVTSLHEQFYAPYATDVPEDSTRVGVTR